MGAFNPGAALLEQQRRLHRRGAWLVLLALALLLLAALVTQPPPPNKRGIHLLLDDGRGRWSIDLWPEHLRYASQVVGEWGYVPQLVRADDLDPARWQVFMDGCAQLKLTPILRLATVYDREHRLWRAPPPDPDGSYRSAAQQYAEFITALQWPTDTHYIMVGNEPNHGEEWGGQPDPAAYARYLIDVAEAIHSADPQAHLLNAAFDPYAPNTGSQPFANGFYYMDSESFMDEMETAYPDVFRHIDVWNSHAYPLGPLAQPPWEQTYRVDWLNDAANPHHLDPPPGVYNRGVNAYEWELWKLSTYGVRGLQVMITETGWRHRETTDPDSLDKGDYPDAATAALYLDLALYGNDGRYPDWPSSGWIPLLRDRRVLAVTPFALDGNPQEWGHSNWLMLDADGRILGTYALFVLMARRGGN